MTPPTTTPKHLNPTHQPSSVPNRTQETPISDKHLLSSIPKYHSKIDKLWITMKRINCDWVTNFMKTQEGGRLAWQIIMYICNWHWHNIVLQMIVFYSCCWCWYYFVLLCTMEWFSFHAYLGLSNVFHSVWFELCIVNTCMSKIYL